MEMSSPLAAMHPPPIPAWGFRRDLPTSNFGQRSFGPKSFNFRDMSMKKPNLDYFTLQPLRGSSPTASLAADMSSNLHVDQSPQFVTPRRSLFTSNAFKTQNNRGEGTTTPPVRWEGVTTPPIPLSSPSFVPDSMDISPLPHKAPFSFISEPRPKSPSPERTPANEDDMLSPCELPTPTQFPAPLLEVPRPVSAAERRKSILIRPSLSRTKNYSTNTVSFKSRETREKDTLPAFKFGAGLDAFPSMSTPSLDECFAPSPPQERKPFGNPLLGASKPKFSLNSGLARANGSPLAAHVRKPAGPPSRRPSKFRRSLSMYEHPGDVMNQKEDTANYTPSSLQSVMDVDDTPALKLPSFVPENEPDSLPRIEHSTLISVLNGDYNNMFDKTVIVDCRFEYEYEGGHIEGAVNFCEKEQLAQELFANGVTTPNTLLVFHCEYSAHRAPLMAKFVRHEDRKVNSFRYPQLSYPEVYILDGGYSGFYESHRSRCFPQNYLRMDAKEHENACERGMNKLRQRSKLSRAQTFAFGQKSCQMEDSPTAIGRSKSGGVLTLGFDDTHTMGRLGGARRMASY
ncbi:Rhodanese-like protein [Aaosphaeria arxii CBS 175.79]|uniref:M-phase inducer phosphatase n=1 Tax=Aaosphaeria arxii CBS 175.79 TaxID=1450172 RepID=A0A6A5XH23_9PLEO|nr:Rhodanese-like protein [Aaosphaeria arxii CBS 175.79]KAF2012210.1 Rhodanese-like protein [Aaosphaeria arxii CBS 175.79]